MAAPGPQRREPNPGKVFGRIHVARAPARFDDRDVHEDADTRRVQVDLEPGEPLRGSVSSDGRRRPFVGWIELAMMLEAARPLVEEEDVDG